MRTAGSTIRRRHSRKFAAGILARDRAGLWRGARRAPAARRDACRVPRQRCEAHDGPRGIPRRPERGRTQGLCTGRDEGDHPAVQGCARAVCGDGPAAHCGGQELSRQLCRADRAHDGGTRQIWRQVLRGVVRPAVRGVAEKAPARGHPRAVELRLFERARQFEPADGVCDDEPVGQYHGTAGFCRLQI